MAFKLSETEIKWSLYVLISVLISKNYYIILLQSSKFRNFPSFEALLRWLGLTIDLHGSWELLDRISYLMVTCAGLGPIETSDSHRLDNCREYLQFIYFNYLPAISIQQQNFSFRYGVGSLIVCQWQGVRKISFSINRLQSSNMSVSKSANY